MSGLLAPLTAAEWTIIQLSLKVALVATLASLPFGVAVAYLLSRKRFPGLWLVDALVHLPLVLPPVVTGYALLVIFGRKGAVGQTLESCCGLVFAFRWSGAALAAAVMAFPLLVRTIIGFAKAMGEFGATITFVASIPGETETLPLAIYAQTQIPGGEAVALRLTLIAVIIAFAAIAASQLLRDYTKRGHALP
ncbi:MAG: molybdate ABC transporter permease subunit [Hyphomicrobiales bacterium]|nr:molybdate ABC transporter permease subunit [Hyphomicrobiales bacterium]